MQRRESENKSNIQQFRMAIRNFCKACEMPKRSTSCRIESKAMKNEFRTLVKFLKPCEAEKNEFRKPCETKENEIRNPLRNFHKPCETIESSALCPTLWEIRSKELRKKKCPENPLIPPQTAPGIWDVFHWQPKRWRFLMAPPIIAAGWPNAH